MSCFRLYKFIDSFPDLFALSSSAKKLFAIIVPTWRRLDTPVHAGTMAAGDNYLLPASANMRWMIIHDLVMLLSRLLVVCSKMMGVRKVRVVYPLFVAGDMIVHPALPAF